jgi:hypothetical protein
VEAARCTPHLGHLGPTGKAPSPACSDTAARSRACRYAGLDPSSGCYRVRVEGCGAYQCNSANTIWELSFCPDSSMTLCVANHGRLDGSAGVSNGVDWVGGPPGAAAGLLAASRCTCRHLAWRPRSPSSSSPAVPLDLAPVLNALLC